MLHYFIGFLQIVFSTKKKNTKRFATIWIQHSPSLLDTKNQNILLAICPHNTNTLTFIHTPKHFPNGTIPFSYCSLHTVILSLSLKHGFPLKTKTFTKIKSSKKFFTARTNSLVQKKIHLILIRNIVLYSIKPNTIFKLSRIS